MTGSAGAGVRVLGARELNRALLARQLLLRPSERTPVDALTHLVGLQSQAPQAGYVALWTRLAGFDPRALSDLLAERVAVRMALMRSTVHLVTAADAAWLRPLLAPVVGGGMTAGSARGRQLAGVDRDLLVAAALDAYADGPLTNPELAAALQPRFPDVPGEALLFVVRGLLPLVQVPPRGLWAGADDGSARPLAGAGTIRTIPLSRWTGPAPAGAEPPEASGQPGRAAGGDPGRLVRRYLAAFGPATVRDLQAWSGLTRLAAAVAAIRDELVEFRSEQGSVLYDLPDAPRPDAETPCPVRFLAEWDQILLGHADRSRVVSAAAFARLATENGIIRGGILIDGAVAGMWARTGPRATTVTVTAFDPWTGTQRAQVEQQAAALVDFLGLDSFRLQDSG